MSDSRILRIDELKQLREDAISRVEQLSKLRQDILSAGSLGGGGQERTWLLQVIDNRRAFMLDRITKFEQGIEIAYENAQPELGALFIDGRKI